MKYKKSLIGLISIGFLGFVLGRAFRFGMNLIIGRIYGPEALGNFTIGVLIIHLGAVFCSLGLGRGAQRVLSSNNNQTPSEIRGTIFSAVSISFLVSAVVTVIFFINWGKLIELFGLDWSNELYIYLIGIPLFTILNVIAFSTRGFGETKYFVYIKEVSQAGVAFFIILLLGFFSSSATSVATAYLISMVTGVVVAIYIIIKLTKNGGKWSMSLDSVPLLKISLPLMLIAASNYFLTWIDTAVLSLYRTPKSVGIYQSSYLYAAITPFSFQAINSIFPHVAAKYHSRGDKKRLKEMYSILTMWGTSITILAGSFLIIFARDLLKLFSNEFIMASSSLRILTVGFIFSVLPGPAAHILSMTNYERIEAGNSVALGVINMFLNLLLVPFYGIIGAAVATSISLGVLNIIRLLEVYKLLSLHPYSHSYIKMGLSLILPITVLFIVSLYINSIIIIIVSGIVSTVGFLYFSYIFNLFDESKIVLEEI